MTADDMKDGEVYVYATGICFCSVCAPAEMEGDEVALTVQRMEPAGTSTGWTVWDEPTFRDGSPMPSPCDKFPDKRRHWLLAA